MDVDSDDSDFYGDEDAVANLRARVKSFNVAQWWKVREGVQVRPKVKTEPVSTPRLHNPYAGVPYAWQLTETVDDFLARLPPDTTPVGPDLPWIYICNPYIPRKDKVLAQNQRSRGNEDEAPEEEGSQLGRLIEGGAGRLEILRDFVEGIKKTSKSKTAIAREIREEQNEAVDDILNLADLCRIRAGKWILFCDPREVNEIWAVVARATANNELGIAAKVAPAPLLNSQRQDRVVCVYTANFRDKSDVQRILQRLKELKLVESRDRAIYYKPDAFTYIGIASGNSWGLKASIYNSFNMIAKPE